ncbi:MAG: hypothetical protein Q7S27_04070 [Nanoarchaeota archaeon]|nr:hypothetical protein [Nanoarchaeota archaeon]
MSEFKNRLYNEVIREIEEKVRDYGGNPSLEYFKRSKKDNILHAPIKEICIYSWPFDSIIRNQWKHYVHDCDMRVVKCLKDLMARKSDTNKLNLELFCINYDFFFHPEGLSVGHKENPDYDIEKVRKNKEWSESPEVKEWYVNYGRVYNELYTKLNSELHANEEVCKECSGSGITYVDNYEYGYQSCPACGYKTVDFKYIDSTSLERQAESIVGKIPKAPYPFVKETLNILLKDNFS